jgi:hypothetical protein
MRPVPMPSSRARPPPASPARTSTTASTTSARTCSRTTHRSSPRHLLRSSRSHRPWPTVPQKISTTHEHPPDTNCSYDRATFDRIGFALDSASPPSLSVIAKAEGLSKQAVFAAPTMTPSLSKTITAEAGPEWAKSKSRDGSFQGRVRAQRCQSSIIAALSARVASRAFIKPLQKGTLADFTNVGQESLRGPSRPRWVGSGQPPKRASEFPRSLWAHWRGKGRGHAPPDSVGESLRVVSRQRWVGSRQPPKRTSESPRVCEAIWGS